jgi:hypothetical protein
MGSSPSHGGGRRRLQMRGTRLAGHPACQQARETAREGQKPERHGGEHVGGEKSQTQSTRGKAHPKRSGRHLGTCLRGRWLVDGGSLSHRWLVVALDGLGGMQRSRRDLRVAARPGTEAAVWCLLRTRRGGRRVPASWWAGGETI